jgi:hypothetical protein
MKLDFDTSSYKFFCDYPEEIVKNSLKAITKNFGKDLKQNINSTEKELRIILFDKLMIDSKLLQLIKFFNFYKKKFKFVFIIGFFSTKQLILLETNNLKIYNNFYQVLVSSFEIFKFFIKAILNFFFYLYKNNNDNNNFKPNKIFNVIFYPHQTTEYADIYSKNFFYSEDLKSNYYKQKILHVELEKREQYINFYKKKKLHYYFHEKNSFKNLFPFSNIKFSIKNIRQWFFCLLILASYRKLVVELNKKIFKDVKICLIANDLTFDNLLGYILKKKRIHTIAIQNRFVASKWKIYTNILNTLCVMDTYSKKNFSQNKNILVKDLPVVGNLLINKNYLKKNIKIKNKIVCFDYIVTTIEDQMFDVCFKNINNFYQDIINLAKSFQDEEFLIKSKYNIKKIPYLSHILLQLKKIRNIEILSENNKNISVNELIYNSKLVITKPSSTIDISLKFKKKIIIHDYELNFKSLLRGYVKFPKNAYYVSSFKDLKKTLKYILLKKYNSHAENNKFYFNNINPKNNLSSILNSLEKKI